jgi:hypothetical protein
VKGTRETAGGFLRILRTLRLLHTYQLVERMRRSAAMCRPPNGAMALAGHYSARSFDEATEYAPATSEKVTPKWRKGAVRIYRN